MNTVAMGLGGTETAVKEKNIHAMPVPLIFAISILAGPLAYIIYRSVANGFAGGSQVLALIALSVIGFEMVWLAYGAFLGILKLLR